MVKMGLHYCRYRLEARSRYLILCNYIRSMAKYYFGSYIEAPKVRELDLSWSFSRQHAMGPAASHAQGRKEALPNEPMQ